MIMGLVITCGVIAACLEVLKGPLGQALARRIQGRGAEQDAEVRHEVAYLLDQVDALRSGLEEAQERLDFTERLLAQARPADRLADR